MLRRVTPPPFLPDHNHHDPLWLWPPKGAESPPALFWTDHMGEVVQAHETPMGACLLSPQSWAPRSYAKPELSSPPSPPPPQIEIKLPPSSPVTPSHKKKATRDMMNKRKTPSPPSTAMVDRWTEKRYKDAEEKLVQVMHSIGAEPWNPVRRQPLKDEVRKHVGDTGLLDHLLKHSVGKVVAGGERLRRQHNSEGTMEYWLERADLAEIRERAGVKDPYWVPPPGWQIGDGAAACTLEMEACQLREEVAALKRDYQSLIQWNSMVEGEMEDEVVQGGESREMEDEVVQGGESREMWICGEIEVTQGGESREMIMGGEMEESHETIMGGEMEEVTQGGESHETMMGGNIVEVTQGGGTRLGDRFSSLLSAGLSGWGTQRKVEYSRRRRLIPSSLNKSVKTSRKQPIRKKKKKDGKTNQKAGHRKEEEKTRGEEMDSPTMNKRLRSDYKVDRWTPTRYQKAEVKLVEIMHSLKAGLWSPIMRQKLREEARKHIGDTGLLDHLLKHMVGKVVGDGTERLQRRYAAEGYMEYWLEPTDLAEIRQKAGVRDPCWIPPVGWRLGDATSPCPCGVKCGNEMSLLREEVATLRRQVEKLNSISQLENQAKYALFEAGGLPDYYAGWLPELAELDEQDGKIYDWYVQLLAGSEGSFSVDES